MPIWFGMIIFANENNFLHIPVGLMVVLIFIFAISIVPVITVVRASSPSFTVRSISFQYSGKLPFYHICEHSDKYMGSGSIFSSQIQRSDL